MLICSGPRKALKQSMSKEEKKRRLVTWILEASDSCSNYMICLGEVPLPISMFIQLKMEG